MTHNSLYSVELERNFLGGLIKKPNIYFQIDGFISEKDFKESFHSKIFSVIKQILSTQGVVDPIIVSEKIKEIGIDKVYDIPIYQYIDDIIFTQITEKGIIDAGKELVKLRIKRELIQNSENEKKFVLESGDKDINQIISGLDKIHNDIIKEYDGAEEPIDIFANIEEILEERAKNPLENCGILTSFPIFNDFFGGFKVGIEAICGRAKNNKSTILLNMGWGSIFKNPNLKVLYLDTELKGNDHQYRAMAAFSQVNANLIETGKWSQNPAFAQKVRNSFPTIKKIKDNFFHIYIGNKLVDDVTSIIKRWYFNKCGKGNPALIIYDYIKIGDEKLSNYNGEHQELGRKINILNELSQRLQIPILTSMQLNRSAITENRDDESVISMTDRLSWFANRVSIFRKKRPEEIAEEGIEFGTHKLINVVARYLGPKSYDLDLVKTTDCKGKTIYKNNFINYKFENFRLTEVGTYRDCVNSLNLKRNLMNNEVNHLDI